FDLDQRRSAPRAVRLRLDASRMKTAAARLVARGGNISWNRHEALVGGAELGGGFHQRLGVRMEGPGQQLMGRGRFNNLAGIHDSDAIGNLADDAEVVR